MAICKEPIISEVSSPKEVTRFINDPRIFQKGTTFFEDDELELLNTQEEVILEIYEDDENQDLSWFKIKAVM